MRRSRSTWSRTAALAACLTLAALAGGCLDSSDPGDPIIPEPPYPFPDTAAKLMANFKLAYDEMNIDEYDNVLHAGFIFVFADGSPVAPTTGIYTRPEDLQSTTRMFAGEQGQDPDGQPKAPVRDIEFSQMERLTEWEEVPLDDPYFPGALRALYDVRLVFDLNTDSTNTITIDCQQLFYVKSVDEEQDDGGTRPHFYLIGQQDLDNK
jgi:hypothetical protein